MCSLATWTASVTWSFPWWDLLWKPLTGVLFSSGVGWLASHWGLSATGISAFLQTCQNEYGGRDFTAVKCGCSPQGIIVLEFEMTFWITWSISCWTGCAEPRSPGPGALSPGPSWRGAAWGSAKSPRWHLQGCHLLWLLPNPFYLHAELPYIRFHVTKLKRAENLWSTWGLYFTNKKLGTEKHTVQWFPIRKICR